MFGNYFLQFTRQKGYGDLLSCLGINLFEFLNNINRLHSHLSNEMKGLQGPDIW